MKRNMKILVPTNHRAMVCSEATFTGGKHFIMVENVTISLLVLEYTYTCVLLHLEYSNIYQKNWVSVCVCSSISDHWGWL